MYPFRLANVPPGVHVPQVGNTWSRPRCCQRIQDRIFFWLETDACLHFYSFKTCMNDFCEFMQTRFSMENLFLCM